MQVENAENPAVLMKRYGDAIRGAIGRMPTEPTDLPAFFDNTERLFENIHVPNAYRAQLLMPYLTDKARALVGHMDQSKASNYDEVKSLILREFKLTPWAYLKRYQTATKMNDETYVMFVTRLQTLLEYYITSRRVSTFNDLISLLIADHVKPMLPSDCLKHVLSVENTSDAGWLPHRKLAEVIDTYLSSHGLDDPNPPKMYPGSSGTVHNRFTDARLVRSADIAKPNTAVSNKSERRCFECDSRLHVVSQCPHRRKHVMPTTRNNSPATSTNQRSARVFTNSAASHEPSDQQNIS